MTRGFGGMSNNLHNIGLGLTVIILGCCSKDRAAPVDELIGQSARVYTLNQIMSFTHVTPLIEVERKKTTKITQSQVGMVVMSPGSSLGARQANLLNELPSLRVLRISSCSLENSFFTSLAAADSLEYLYARDTILSESDLRAIAKLKNLKFLDVGKTNVSREWVEEEIPKSIPGILVYVGDWQSS